jgi:hypothetical protein
MISAKNQKIKKCKYTKFIINFVKTFFIKLCICYFLNPLKINDISKKITDISKKSEDKKNITKYL